MAKQRIPLPKQVEKTHKAETDYDRRREQLVLLDEVYADEDNQPSPKYMKMLKRLQVKALSAVISGRKNGKQR